MEVRYISYPKEHAQDRIFDPFQNIYPCHIFYPNHNKFCDMREYDKTRTKTCKYPEDQSLLAAIWWLQCKRVKQLLDDISGEHLLSLSFEDPVTYKKMFPDKSTIPNILETLCSRNVGELYSFELNVQAYILIVKMLLKKCPQMLNDKCYTNARRTKRMELINLFHELVISEEIPYTLTDGRDICYLCLSHAEQNLILKRSCQCGSPIHYDCLKKLLQDGKSNCTICKQPFSVIPWKGNRLICPMDDIYPPPLFSNVESTKIDRPKNLEFALMYLQVERIEELISGPLALSEDEIYNQSNYYKMNSLHSICTSNTVANLFYRDYPEHYESIFDLLLRYLPNIWRWNVKDGFNKTPLDYLFKYGRDVSISKMSQLFDLFAIEIGKRFSDRITKIIYFYILDPRLYSFSIYLRDC